MPRWVSGDSALAEVVESSRNRFLGCRGKGLLLEVHAASGATTGGDQCYIGT